MSAAETMNIDPIMELRLRKWAREHYAARNERGRNWHPIVLQEMEFRDAELGDPQFDRRAMPSPFVPLAPTETHYLDAPHAAVPAPKSLLHDPESVLYDLFR